MNSPPKPPFRKLKSPIDRGIRRSYPPNTENPYPWNKLSKDKPSDWGWGVTVCIAAIAEIYDGLVLITDTMISTGETSSDDTTLKIKPITDNWYFMFAGDDLSYIPPIESLLISGLDYKTSYSADHIAATFADAYQAVRERTCEAKFLKPFKMGMAEFKDEGKDKLPAHIFSDIFYEIREFDLGCQFLVAGFDEAGTPHIFTVSNPGVVEWFDIVGFWAIGSGQRSALSSLFFSEYNFRHSLSSGVYRVYEAKLMAEKALGVGKSTLLLSLERRNDKIERVYLLEDDLKPLRSAWEKEGKPRLPQGILDKVVEIFEKRSKEDKIKDKTND